MGSSAHRPGIKEQITWVYTDNLEKSSHFYGDVIGLPLAIDEGSARIFKVADGGFVGVCQAWGDRQVAPEGTCLTFVTDEVDAWHRYLSERGIELEGPPHALPQFGIYACFARDPSGYRVEFQQFLDS